MNPLANLNTTGYARTDGIDIGLSHRHYESNNQ